MRGFLPESISVMSLKDLGFTDELPEDFDTLEDNSLQKARFVWDKFGKNCLAEDTGLFVPALGDAPGVYSARYAGLQKSDQDNIALLLKNLSNHADRSAYFKTVMTLMLDGVAHQFSGELHGLITHEPGGNGGFGYDPVFSHETGRTLAEISKEEKNAISHRGKALRKVVDFLGGI